MALRKILLVDDSEPFNFLHRSILNQNGITCAIDEVLNGEQALEYLGNTALCPDVVLLDLNMPVMDGFEFLERFKHTTKCADVTKIYILTSSTRDEDRVHALKYRSVKGYFDKPLSDIHVKQILNATRETV